jgi:hypothetical protein
MSDAKPTERTGPDWVDITSAVLLALAAVMTAWSSYQSSRWNAEQARASGRTNALRISAARAAGLASSQTEVDIATFIQWVDARAHDDQALEDFYLDRFRPEFQPAFEAWVETDPLVNDDAPPTPFAMEEYRLDAAVEAEDLDVQSAESSANALANLQRATNYVLAVVLFAVSLFFAGMSTKLRFPILRRALLLIGCTVFVSTGLWVATFPINIRV